MLFDTHAHLNDRSLYDEVEDIWLRAKQAGVAMVNNVGFDWPSSLLAVRLADRFPGEMVASVGVHPHDAETLDETFLQKMSDLAALPSVVAWGEIGLDYYRDLSPRELQKQVFREQIRAAKAQKMPIIIHDRDAHEDTLQIVREEQAGMNGGIFHCFSGSVEMAKQCLDLGFMISFAGPLTFRNARVPLAVAKMLPLDSILVETDCPYLSPEPYRGKTNEPARVVYVAEKLAQLRGLAYEEVVCLTQENARRLFRLPRSQESA